MKTTPLLLLPSILLFGLFTNTLAASTNAAAPPPVLDVTGNQLRTGVEYYILPAFQGNGGGMSLLATPGNETCRVDVVQSPSEIVKGSAVKFTPVNPKKGLVREHTDLNIQSTDATVCVKSNIWSVDSYDEKTGKYFVKADGVAGNPGPETLSNWFKIEKYENGKYKLVYCPTVCDICKVICSDLGTYIQKNGYRRLALSDKPFPVVFQKK